MKEIVALTTVIAFPSLSYQTSMTFKQRAAIKVVRLLCCTCATGKQPESAYTPDIPLAHTRWLFSVCVCVCLGESECAQQRQEVRSSPALPFPNQAERASTAGC